MKIGVTGTGVISSLGKNLDENIKSLESGISGITYSQKYRLKVGQVALSNKELELITGLQNASRTTLLGVMAAQEAWGNSKIDKAIRTGIISSTSVGGLDKMEQHYLTYLKDPSYPIEKYMIYENGGTTEKIAASLGMEGFIDTISTACSSGANSIMYGARLIKAGILDRVLVGGVDPISTFNLKGFSSLMIYDQEICKPFDKNRNGLNMGEGAGFILLENEHSIARSKNNVICEIKGWGNATDAYHQTASSPEGIGATITMQQAIRKAGLDPEMIDYVNMHGTGTENNDLSETTALRNVFKEDLPFFSSTKGFTGHTLAASGAIEAVFSIESIRHQIVWPNCNFHEPFDPLFTPVLHPLRTEVKNVLSNSFGFGGNCTSLIFSA